MSTRSKGKKGQKGQFDSLTTNAFDFLEQAIREFDENPKRTIIDFYAAVELFIKARLMKEHWSLVITKPDTANSTSFEMGDFQSVTLKEARQRLKNIANDDIGNEAFLCFTAIGNHRNRLVHFHGDQSDLKSIAASEVLKGVYYLDVLLSKRWNTFFKDHAERMAGIRSSVLKLREFLAAKFEALREEIEKERDAGRLFGYCVSCGHEAAIIERLGDRFYIARCWVCEAEHGRVVVKCPECGEAVYVSDGECECGNCEHPIDSNYVIEQFAPPEPYDKSSLYEYHESLMRIGCCDECSWQFENTIHPIDESYQKWMCIICNEVFDQMDECAQCGVTFPFNDGYPLCSNCR